MTHFLTQTLLTITIWITAFLILLNTGCALLFRRRRPAEIFSYLTVALIELAIFSFAFLLHLGILSHIPYRLPPHLPFNRAEIGAAIALGIGLFPAAYWHRSSASHLRARIAKDATAMHDHQQPVRARSNPPGEWLN
ncbi:MAG: hypothetical protein NVS3B14_23410 [Ktedonobacteraceae bacterium]